MKLHVLLHFALVLFTLPSFCQTSFCPNDPPRNPYLADSPYPTYHRNSYAQASTCLAGPLPSDNLLIKAKKQIEGGTSPWVYLSDKYPNGERVLYYSNATHVFKFIDNGDDLVTVDSLRIDFDPITSFGWNFLLTKDKVWFTYDPKYNPDRNQYTRIFKLTDADVTDPYSEIVMVDRLNLGDYGIEKVNNFNLNYNGELVFTSDGNEATGRAFAGVIDQDFNLLDTLSYPMLPDEIVSHNAFPIDENNSFYRLTTHRLIKFDWDGKELSIDWQAYYDFVNDGPTGSFAEGSGTTPTLMGWGEGNDQLIVVADGHANNNLIAFWRELPPDWEGKPGRDIRFADAISIPFAVASNNTFQSIENSPTVFGYEVAIAQFNGFLGYDCDNVKGVQKFRWDTTEDKFVLEWATNDVNMNGVLLYSEGSNLLYGSGKEADCNYYYYALDWDDGSLAFKKLLGPEGTFLDDPFYDAGSNNIIDDEGNIYFPGGSSLIKLEKLQDPLAVAEIPTDVVTIYPNPTTGHVNIQNTAFANKAWKLQIFSSTGTSLFEKNISGAPQYEVDISHLAAGIYFVVITSGDQVIRKKLVKERQ